MSRTIVHTPYNVANLTGLARTHENHDHRHGVCAFPSIDDYRQRFGAGLHSFGVSRYAWIWEFPCWQQANHADLWRFCADGPPADYRRLAFEKPARQRARLKLRQAMREHNAEGETDTEPDPYRGRHAAHRDWF